MGTPERPKRQQILASVEKLVNSGLPTPGRRSGSAVFEGDVMVPTRGSEIPTGYNVAVYPRACLSVHVLPGPHFIILVDGATSRRYEKPEDGCSMAVNIFKHGRSEVDSYSISGGNVYRCRETYRSHYYDRVSDDEAEMVIQKAYLVVRSYFRPELPNQG